MFLDIALRCIGDQLIFTGETMIPVVSIVIPTYKRPHLLARCLHALVQQQFPKDRYEIIVVTDGPDEETPRLAMRPGNVLPVIQVLALPSKKGPAAARNLGWKTARGKLILFTDDDCMPHNYWVEAYYKAYLEQGLEEAVFTGQVLVPCSSRPTDYEKNIAWLEKADFVTANCACTKAALVKVNGFDETFTMAWREDSDLEFRFINHRIPIRFIQQAVVTHPVRKASWGVSLKEQKKSMYNALLYKKYPALYRQKISKGPLWNYYAIAGLFILAIIAAVLQWTFIMLFALVGWVLLIAQFTIKRLTGTTHTPAHVTEMIVTSMLIPFLSLYWTIYGSLKFKTVFL
jgi:glycosyltransferase involved in cell wall biosynthesis